ncbi:MAG: hypothetical protein AVDCRST_MAG49-990 [uncultured Thermomicrobiales bacterium]|uniref:Uncharacterized protein n=1 Tax=uncultured Thermomicrobiales bacterium TaxID=1645740 RepID=A0A6J4U7B2_9BACT|nr:MAG: hypothetical protein AVDCRST_MAG49-990 [uncultured Thermomicrobiales bacterium]
MPPRPAPPTVGFTDGPPTGAGAGWLWWVPGRLRPSAHPALLAHNTCLELAGRIRASRGEHGTLVVAGHRVASPGRVSKPVVETEGA